MDHLESYLTRLYQGGADRMAQSLRLWKQGIGYEIDFWTRWFETRGLEWPEDYRRRLLPQPLSPYLEQLLPPQGEVRRIIDIGAGPLTLLGAQTDRVSVVATDPLATHYRSIMERFEICAPIATDLAFAEDLSARFPSASFQLVTCTNALDHAIEPLWGIVEMLIILERGGNIVLGHRRNEAEFENYSGFHQWNFDKQGDRFVVWNKSYSYSVSDILGEYADLAVDISGGEKIEQQSISVIITKRREFDFDMEQHHRSLRAALLEGMVRDL